MPVSFIIFSNILSLVATKFCPDNWNIFQAYLWAYLILTFTRAVVTKEIFYIDFNVCLILLERRDLLGFYCRASIVYSIMLLALILTPSFSSPLSKENVIGVRIQSHIE